MAFASPMAIPALPDRAPAERPDGKPAEAAAGHFAGLMAQISQSQATPSPVDPAPGPGARVHRSTARKAAPATDAPSAPTEVGHRAAPAATSEPGTPGPLSTNPKVPQQPAPEAKAASPLAKDPKNSTQDTLAAATKPPTVPPVTDPRTPAAEAPPQGPATVPAVLLPPDAVPAPKAAPMDAPAVLAAAPGLASAAPAGTPPTPGLPEPPSLPSALQMSMVPGAAAPTAMLTAAPTTAPTHAPPPTLDMAPPGTPPLTAPAAAPALPEPPAPKPSAQSADPALLQTGLAGPGASLKVTRGTGEPSPGPVTAAAPSLAEAPMTGKPSLPAALPQELVQLQPGPARQPEVTEAEGPIGQAPLKGSGTPGSLDPAEPKSAPNLQAIASRTLDGASPALLDTLQRVAEAPGAEEPAPSPAPQTTPPPAAATASQPLVPAARPQELAQLLATAMSQPAATGAKGTIRQAPPAIAPQPALDAATPDAQALVAPEATPAQQTSAQAPAPALLQAVAAGPGISLKGTRGTEEPAPGPAVKVPLSMTTEPLTGKPSLPAELPQALAQLPPKAALQPGAEAAGPTGQAPLKGSSALPDLVETKPAPDLQALASRTLDGAALAMGTPQRAMEGPTPAAPAAPPAPSQPAATPPSAPVLQVEGGLRWMLKSGAQEAQLQLHPDALGQVTIHLKVEGGEVHAKVWVSEAASVQAVKEGQPHLEQALKEQGLHLGSFDLQQGHRPFHEAPSAPISRERTLAEAAVARQEAPAPPPVAILNPHHVELYA